MNRAPTVAAALALLGAAGVWAHPLGNNTVNRQSTLTVTPAAIELRYLLDLAEIPTLIETQRADRDADGKASDEEWQAHARRWAVELRPHLALALDDKPLALRLRSEGWTLVPGEAGLLTLRLEARYTAQVEAERPTASLSSAIGTSRTKRLEGDLAALGCGAHRRATVPQRTAAGPDRFHARRRGGPAQRAERRVRVARPRAVVAAGSLTTGFAEPDAPVSRSRRHPGPATLGGKA